MRAIVSVADREGLVPLARELQSHNVTVFSTSGTASALQDAGIPARSEERRVGKECRSRWSPYH